jgi:hypothetical protein
VTAKFRSWSCAAALTMLFPLTLAAQSVQVQVKDLDTDEIIGTVQPGGSFTLSEGDRVRLIMTVQGRGRTLYPQTEYWEGTPNGGCVRITRASIENANATVEAVGSRSRSESIGYRIVEDVGLSSRALEGSITLRIAESSSGAGAPAASPSGSWERDLTNSLYKGILMRDMDEQGARGYIDRISRGDHRTVVQIADEMSRSEESRIRIYQRGVNNQQRLIALYENLLDLSSDEIDEDEWDEDLRLLNDGRIAEVVGGIVRSRRFREIQDLED